MRTAFRSRGKIMSVSRVIARLAGMSVLFLSMSVGQATAQETFGLIPDEFVAKTHAPVKMLQTGGVGNPEHRRADLTAIKSEPALTQAGAHPDGSVTFKMRLRDPDASNPFPAGYARDVLVDLPAGFLGNPEAVPACARDDFEAQAESRGPGTISAHCSPASQVGVVTLDLGSFPAARRTSYPLYRITRPAHAPAAFGFNFGPQIIVLNPRLRSDGDYGISVDTTDIASVPYPVRGATVTLWGVPAHERYFDDRWDPVAYDWGADSGITPRPFLINPPRCNTGDLTTHLTTRSWQEPWRVLPRDLDPAQPAQGSPQDYVSMSPEPTGCELLPRFRSEMDMRPVVPTAGSPSGYDVKLTMPYNDDPNGRSFAHLKKVEVALPEGVSVSPSAAHGLVGCTDAQAGFGTQSVADCPDASKIGQVSVKTPLLPDRLNGSVYIGSPTRDQLLRVFLILKGFGVTVRIAGDVNPDPVTGQVHAVFDQNPQVPFTELDLSFDAGQRASLINPVECGTHTTVARMTSWNGDVYESRSSFEVSADGRGAPCPPGQPFDPWMTGGSVNPVSAEYSPFLIKFGRTDIEQEINSVYFEIPPGLVAKLRGVELCPPEQADAGLCGPGSRIGHVQVASGAGTQPFWVPGPGKAATAVFLSGPYRGAPYSLSIVVPAQAGPFDLGRVVVRSPIWVDERTAELSTDIAESRVYNRFGALAQVIPGRMPTILEGIPLKVKEVRVLIDRDQFMLNPTNCNAHYLRARIGSAQGASVLKSEHFQAADCAALDFAPRFRAKILDRGRRSTVRSWHPRTRFTVVPRPGDANIAGARVALPSSTILDQGNIGTTCTRAQMAAHDCPEKSVVGFARAWSPLLNRAIQGPVYLAANGGARPLPDLTAVLDGEVRIALIGEISTLRTRGKARLQNTFRIVPDAPVSRFVLTMRGGRNGGLLVNSTDLCRISERGVAVFTGQNGRRHRLNPRLGLSFRGCAKVRRQVARRIAKRKAARRAAASRTRRARDAMR